MSEKGPLRRFGGGPVNVGFRHLARVPPRNLHIPVLRQLPPAQLPRDAALEGSVGGSRASRHPSWVRRSGSRRWNTRRGTRTTPRYSPISTPNSTGLPLGIPAGVAVERRWETVPVAIFCSQVRRTKNRTLGGSDQMNDWESAQPLRRRGDRMRRREFITLIAGSAFASPVIAHAQQKTIPVIGFLSSASPNAYAGRVTAFRKGLNESGYIDGKDVAIEFRWAKGQYDQLPVFAADLVRQKVAVILSSGGDIAALSAKAATSSIPIVTVSGTDPVQAGLVASFNRPGGNITGASFVATELETKRLEILRDLVPTAALIGVLINPTNPAAESRSKDLQAAARTLKRNIHIVSAGSESDLEPAFATLIEQRRTTPRNRPSP
jgi:hypothetical protein